MTSPSSRRDTLWILGFLAAGALGLACYIGLYDRAWPVASLNFRVDREQAFEAAEGYLERLGYDLAEYESARIFSRAGLPQVFLERTLGLAEANGLVRDWISIWSWQIRWFKPLQKEELRVNLDPGGRVTRFSHAILESDEGASLPQEEARAVAESFLTEVQGFSLDDYEPIEASSVDRPARRDHTFTWRKRDFVVGEDGHYRLWVTVQGDKAGGFGEYLKVPETFARDYREIRSRAGLIYNVATAVAMALVIATAVFLVRKYRRRELSWRVPVVVGVVTGALSYVGSLNGYPLSYFGYDTTQSYLSFILNFLFSGVFSAALIAVMVILFGTAGDAAARDASGSDPLARLSPGRWRSAAFGRVVLIGYGLAFAHLGYVTLFYILGNEYLGVWAPAAVTEYSNTYSTWLPWIYPLLTGLVATTVEEFLFRLVAISLLLRWFGKPWLAVLLPGVLWAFLHANYAQEPIYIRGLELTVVGVVFGLVFLRFGIWTTVVSHYVYNCFLGTYPMMQSDSLYFKTSGFLALAVICLPAIPAIWALVTGRRDPIDEPWEAPSAGPAPAEPEAPPPPEPDRPETPAVPPVERKTPRDYLVSRKGLITFAVLGLAGWSAYFAFKPYRYGEYARESLIPRAEAVEKAEEIREQLGLELEGYRRTASFSSSLGSGHFTHLLRAAGPERADTLAAEHTSSWHWYVRWFRPLEKEELTIGIDGHGELSYLSHAVPESQEGAELEIDKAEAIAREFLLRYLNRDVADTTLYMRLEGRSFKRENRVDHSFVWERTDIKVEDGEFRVIASVHGDRIGRGYKAYKAPEEFLRELRERTAKSSVVDTLGMIFIFATLVLGVIHLLRAYRRGDVAWGLPLRLGLLVGALTLFEALNELPVFYRGFDTSVALGTFLGKEAIGLALKVVGMAIMAFLAGALGDTFFRSERPGEMQLPGWIDVLRLRAGSAALWGQVIFLVLCWLGISRGLGVYTARLNLAFLGEYLTASGGAPAGINTWLPALDEVIDEVRAILFVPLLLLGVLFVWRRTAGRTWLLVLGMVLVLLFRSVVSPARDFHHAGFLFAGFLPMVLVLGYLVWKHIRFNLLFYLVMIWGSLVPLGIRFLEFEAGYFKINGVLIVLFGLAPLFLALLAWHRERAPAAGSLPEAGRGDP